MSETTSSRLYGWRQYGQLVVAFTLPPQWRSRGEVEVRAPARRPWERINTLYSANKKRGFKQKFKPKYA